MNYHRLPVRIQYYVQIKGEKSETVGPIGVDGFYDPYDNNFYTNAFNRGGQEKAIPKAKAVNSPTSVLEIQGKEISFTQIKTLVEGEKILLNDAGSTLINQGGRLFQIAPEGWDSRMVKTPVLNGAGIGFDIILDSNEGTKYLHHKMIFQAE